MLYIVIVKDFVCMQLWTMYLSLTTYLATKTDTHVAVWISRYYCVYLVNVNRTSDNAHTIFKKKSKLHKYHINLFFGLHGYNKTLKMYWNFFNKKNKTI